jgi:serine/threonine protein kinase
MAELDKSLMEHITFESAGTYEFLEEIGRGGMGIVYLGERHCEGVSDYVVLKTIKMISDSLVAQLKREANIAAKLRHENIVKTYGLETIPVSALPEKVRNALESLEEQKKEAKSTENTKVRSRLKLLSKQAGFSKLKIRRSAENEKRLYLIVMDYVEGTDLKNLFLAHMFEDLLIPPMLGAFIISRICRALSYAHDFLIHRDVSPENILIDNQGVAKLTDFGVAVEPTQEIKMFAGKFSYMAPEQLRGGAIDQRADIFALGLVSYQILTGILLYPTPTHLKPQQQYEQIKRMMEKEIVPPHRICNDIPVELSEIVMKMLAKDPDERYIRISEAANELERKYLYAKGYGPTSLALSSYIDIFSSKFQKYTEDQLGQLSFLRDDRGKIQLKRRIRAENYTIEGKQVIHERPDLMLAKKLVLLENNVVKAFETTDYEAEAQPLQSKLAEHRNLIKLTLRENVTETFHLAKENTTIGRSAGTDIIIIDGGISRQHAQFSVDGNKRVYVEDLKSNNGTFVNGTRIEEKTEIFEGNIIRFGKRLEVTFIREFLEEKEQEIQIYDLIENSFEDYKKNNSGKTNFYFELPHQESLFVEVSDYIGELIQQTGLADFVRFQLIGVVTEILNFLSQEQEPEETLSFAFQLEEKQLKIAIRDGGKGNGFRALLNSIKNFKGGEAVLSATYLITQGQVKMILKCPGKLEFDHSNQEIQLIKLLV